MNNIITALTLLSALLTLLGEASAAIDEMNKIIMKARSEGRDISDEELDTIKKQSQLLTDALIAKLKEQAAS